MMANLIAKPHAILFLGLSACAAGFLFSQQTQTPSPDEVSVRSIFYWPRAQFTLRVDTRLVEVGVVVRDNKGRAVSGLNRGDFTIDEAGKEQAIRTFARGVLSPRL